MGLANENPPPRADRLLQGHLSRLLSEPSGAAFMGGLESIQSIDASVPHPVYVAGRDDILEGKLLDVGGPVAWRYLVVRAGEDLGAAEMGLNPEAAEGLEFGGLNRGPFVRATLEAVKAAQELPEVQEADYDLRFLKVPSLRFVALWLHGPNDLILPLEDHRASGLDAFNAYAPAVVLERLMPLARQDAEEGDDESN